MAWFARFLRTCRGACFLPAIRWLTPPANFDAALRAWVPWGTVGALQPPVSRALAEFDSPDDVLFRVRVTSPGTPEEPHGLLLAEADRIRLRAPEDLNDPRTPLLPVVPSHDLGDLLWRIDYEDHPRLLINADAGDYKQIGLEPGFVAVVYPAALREVLERILRREEHRDYDDPEHPLHTPGDLVEQLASRQELVTNRAFLAAATALYVDPQTGQPKRGGGGKSRGTARRLADFCNQIDVTWDLYALEPTELLAKLPKEFQRFQPAA